MKEDLKIQIFDVQKAIKERKTNIIIFQMIILIKQKNQKKGYVIQKKMNFEKGGKYHGFIFGDYFFYNHDINNIFRYKV